MHIWLAFLVDSVWVKGLQASGVPQKGQPQHAPVQIHQYQHWSAASGQVNGEMVGGLSLTVSLGSMWPLTILKMPQHWAEGPEASFLSCKWIFLVKESGCHNTVGNSAHHKAGKVAAHTNLSTSSSDWNSEQKEWKSETKKQDTDSIFLHWEGTKLGVTNPFAYVGMILHVCVCVWRG